jgi:hypothetical protein
MGLSRIVLRFLSLRIHINLFHWQTYAYGQHKSSDHFLDEFTETMDRFVETYLGKCRPRKNLVLPSSSAIPLTNMNKKKMLEALKDFRTYLDKEVAKDMPSGSKNEDLFNLCDELISITNRYLYQLSLYG